MSRLLQKDISKRVGSKKKLFILGTHTNILIRLMMVSLPALCTFLEVTRNFEYLL